MTEIAPAQFAQVQARLDSIQNVPLRSESAFNELGRELCPAASIYRRITGPWWHRLRAHPDHTVYS